MLGIEPQSPGHPVRSQTLCWLSYPGSGLYKGLEILGSGMLLISLFSAPHCKFHFSHHGGKVQRTVTILGCMNAKYSWLFIVYVIYCASVHLCKLQYFYKNTGFYFLYVTFSPSVPFPAWISWRHFRWKYSVVWMIVLIVTMMADEGTSSFMYLNNCWGLVLPVYTSFHFITSQENICTIWLV
jgi:hypothetical protein